MAIMPLQSTATPPCQSCQSCSRKELRARENEGHEEGARAEDFGFAAGL